MLVRRGGDEHVMTFSKGIAAGVAGAGPTGSPGGGEWDDDRLRTSGQYFDRQLTSDRGFAQSGSNPGHPAVSGTRRFVGWPLLGNGAIFRDHIQVGCVEYSINTVAG